MARTKKGNQDLQPAPRPESQVLASRNGSGVLLEQMARGSFCVPRAHRCQRGFLRTLRRAGSNRKVLESVHALRSAIVLSARRSQESQGGVVLALSGVEGGEGTSFLTLLLALSLGNSSHLRVAVLDGRFDGERFQALADLLDLSRNSVSLKKGASQVIGYANEAQPNVYFLRNVADEGQLDFFSDKELGRFLQALRSKFDLTVIDMPPLMRETSSVFLAPALDHLYLVAAAGRTRRVHLAKAVAAARAAGVRVSGVVLNRQRAPWWARLFWREFFW